jgi:beta-lactamase class A
MRLRAAVCAGLLVIAAGAASARAAVDPETRFERLVDRAGPGATSVAVLDERTGRTLARGATHGMRCASIVKVLILEAVLLVDQRHSVEPDASQRALATSMIEHSDNDAADALYQWVGGARFERLLHPLGLNPSITLLDPDDQWGLTRTSAMQELLVLGNLVDADSPLTLAHRSWVLRLMRAVESDQRWGVPVVADPDSTAAVKNGWLPLDDDGGLWIVNSIGVVQLHGHRVLMAIMTQHGSDFGSGVRRVQNLAEAMADALATPPA